MSGIISVTPEELKSQALVYARAREAIQQQIEALRRTNEQMAQQWRGQAFQAYLSQYDQLEGNIRQFQDLLTSINEQCNKYAETIAARDAQDATSFGF